MIPVVGNNIQILFRHQRSLGPHIASLLLFILDPTLQRLNHLGPLGHQKRKSLSDNVNRCEQLHIPSQLIMVTVLDIIQIFQILGQLLLGIEGCSVNSLKHGSVGIPSPVSA